jgi:hypothetical protein
MPQGDSMSTNQTPAPRKTTFVLSNDEVAVADMLYGDPTKDDYIKDRAKRMEKYAQNRAFMRAKGLMK